MKIKQEWKRFKNWSLPSKASVLGLPLALIIFFFTLLLPNYCSRTDNSDEFMDEENFTLTIVKFGSSQYIDNFYCDVIFNNKGSESVIIRDVALLFSHNKFRGGQLVYAEKDYFIVQSQSEMNTQLIFGKSKEDLWIKIHLYSEAPFHLGLKFRYSIGDNVSEFIYPISKNFKVFPNLGGYASNDGDILPIKLQISPIKDKSSKILEYPFDIQP